MRLSNSEALQRMSGCIKWTCMSQHAVRGSHRPENVAPLSHILWPVGPIFVRAAVGPNMLNVPESASENDACCTDCRRLYTAHCAVRYLHACGLWRWVVSPHVLSLWICWRRVLDKRGVDSTSYGTIQPPPTGRPHFSQPRLASSSSSLLLSLL